MVDFLDVLAVFFGVPLSMDLFALLFFIDPWITYPSSDDSVSGDAYKRIESIPERQNNKHPSVTEKRILVIK